MSHLSVVNTLDQQILSIPDLSSFKKSEPLKTSQEIRAEWKKERLGKFTASEFIRLVAYPKKNELSSGAITYVKKKVVESLTVPNLDDGYISVDMQWGMDHELDAVESFSRITKIKNIEFIGDNQKYLSLNMLVGGTPDGLTKSSGLEIKCPNSDTHLDYMDIVDEEDLKKIMPKYYWQIQGLMMITKCKYWYFVSYDPRYKLKKLRTHIAVIKENKKDQAFLKKRLRMAVKLKKEMLRAKRSKTPITALVA